MDKSLILVEDLHRTIEHMYGGTATVTFCTNENNASVWEIRGHKKDLVVLLHYQNDCIETNAISSTEDTFFVKEESTDDGNMNHLNESSPDIKCTDDVAVVVYTNRILDGSTCQPTNVYASQSTTCNNVSKESLISQSNDVVADKKSVSDVTDSTCQPINDNTSQSRCHSAPVEEAIPELDMVCSITKNVGGEFRYASSLKSELEHESKTNGQIGHFNYESVSKNNINVGATPCWNETEDTRTSLIYQECETYLHNAISIIEEEAVDSKMLQLLPISGNEQALAKKLQIEPVCNSNDTNTSHMEDGNINGKMKLKNCFVLLEPLDITDLKINHLSTTLEPDTFSITGQIVRDGRKSVECSKCRKHFFIKSTLESVKHIQTMKNIHLCPCCENSAGCKSNVNVHLQDHSLHCCSECSITFCDLNSYNLHMQNKHFDYSRCEKLSRDESGSTEKSFVYSSHDKKLQLTYFSKEQKFICSREKAFECLHCDKIFCSKQILKHHELDCHTGLSQSYECFQCNKKFKRKHGLVQHKLVHSGVKPYECFQCNKKFNWKHDLVRHKLIHSGVKHECSQCNKKFNRKSSLQRHQHIHSGVRPHECFQSNKKFADKNVLVRHKQIHSGMKPYECSQCNKKFTQKQALVWHKLIHSGVKPHECSQCNKKFTYKHCLLRHKLIHS